MRIDPARVAASANIVRVNIGYGVLTMNQDRGFDAQVFGLRAGIFSGHFLFELPGALVAEKCSPRIWLARIMITWGVISGILAFMHSAWQFYLILSLSLTAAGLLILTLKRHETASQKFW